MAMEDEDRKNELLGQSSGADSSPGGSAFAGESGGAVAGGGASPVGGAPKQSSAWTNIQDYLTANKDTHASADFFKNSVDKSFDDESQAMRTQGDAAETSAKAAADQTNIGQDQASKLVQDASSLGKGSDTYNQNVNQLKQGLQQYGGPTSYSYGLSNQAQQYGTGLQSNPSSVMHDIYNQKTKAATGTGLTQGETDLQDLFDANDSALPQLQQSALAKYAGLNTDVSDPNGYVAQTNNAVKNYVGNIHTNQANLKGYLNQNAQSAKGDLSNLTNQWNDSEMGLSANPYAGQSYSVAGLQGFMGDKNYARDALGVDASKFGVHSGGGTADLSNVDGGDRDRSQWNTIQDVLGGQMIDASSPIQHSSWDFDQNAYNQAASSALQRINAKAGGTGWAFTGGDVLLRNNSDGGGYSQVG